MATKKKIKKNSKPVKKRSKSATNKAALRSISAKKQSRTGKDTGPHKRKNQTPKISRIAKRGAEQRSSKSSTPRGEVGALAFEPKGLGSRSAGQSGDMQGLSNLEGANSESVAELLEEGNAFEAEIVKGVEDAPDADRGPIKTHEVPGDDIPEEYLDSDDR
ncbi:MAG: hypothetical protein NVS9B4_27270 [Candidatus Acidiferrum sp.]